MQSDFKGGGHLHSGASKPPKHALINHDVLQVFILSQRNPRKGTIALGSFPHQNDRDRWGLDRKIEWLHIPKTGELYAKIPPALLPKQPFPFRFCLKVRFADHSSKS